MTLMDRVRATLRVKRYSLRTEKTYCYWIRFFIRFYSILPVCRVMRCAIF
ncbi:integrase-like protein [Vreelandella songnenensis]|uniref:Integrase-like protein n=1 Tax=Vreelandella songnenensis TaxID=1176243 RepID=A0A2T0V5D0_9GAMM|nr:integrase-like protein [Halomonas songnenensis]